VLAQADPQLLSFEAREVLRAGHPNHNRKAHVETVSLRK